MGKHSNFETREREFYPTPMKATLPLIAYLQRGTRFAEPCAGDGQLISNLEAHGHQCVAAYDLAPQADGISQLDASFLTLADLRGADAIITNPPFGLAQSLAERFSLLRPTWLLLPLPYIATVKWSGTLQRGCSDLIPIGRVQWFEGTDGASKEDYAWARFTAQPSRTVWHPRRRSPAPASLVSQLNGHSHE